MRHCAIFNAVILEASGADCLRYLEARLTNKVKSLAPGLGMLAAALTPQGKTQGYFSCYMLEGPRFLLQSDGGDRSEVIKALKQYIVADRVQIDDLSDKLRLLRVIPGDRTAEILSKFAVSSEHISGMHCALSQFGYVCLKSFGKQLAVDLFCRTDFIPSVESALSELGSRELDASGYLLARLKADQPAFPEELQIDALFAEGAPSESISYNKGCYVGQEVMEKISSHGKTSRVVKRLGLKGELKLAPGTEIFECDPADAAAVAKPLGKVLNAAYDPEQGTTLFFALLRNQSSYLQIKVAERIASIL